MADNFEYVTKLGDPDIDLIKTSLLIAKDEYPHIDVESYTRQINGFATDIQSRLPSKANAKCIISKLNEYLFEELGFSGNLNDYYDPRNSYLNEVLDRKLGIPISLSIIYIETGKLLGLDLQGVSFPGHFLVRFNVGQGAIILDPYYGGVSLSKEELLTRYNEVSEEVDQTSLEDLLMPASNKAIIERVLRNLRGLYLFDRQHEKALRSADKIVTLSPNNPDEYLVRGAIYKELECFRSALRDYQHYVTLVPEAQKNESIRSDIISLQEATTQLH